MWCASPGSTRSVCAGEIQSRPGETAASHVICVYDCTSLQFSSELQPSTTMLVRPCVSPPQDATPPSRVIASMVMRGLHLPGCFHRSTMPAESCSGSLMTGLSMSLSCLLSPLVMLRLACLCGPHYAIPWHTLTSWHEHDVRMWRVIGYGGLHIHEAFHATDRSEGCE